MTNKKMTYPSPLLAVVGAMCLAAVSQSHAQNVLTGSPPFVVMQSGVGYSGYSVEHFKGIAKSMGQTATIRQMPWARCLREVAAGKIDIAVDAYDDAERRTKFLYSKPYYTLTPQVFLRISKIGGDALPKSAAELSKFNGCGVHEYTYEHYGLDAKRLDRGAKSIKLMFQMLQAGRCDYAVEELEYVMGGRQTATEWPDESSLRSYRPDWAKAPQIHYLVGRSHPHGKMLQTAVNQAIDSMEKSGETKALRAAYFSSSSAKRSGN